MDYIKRKLSEAIFGEEPDLPIREARRRAGVKLHIPRQEFHAFRRELESLGIAELEKNGRTTFLKKVRL